MAALASLVRLLLRGVLPYPDPLRRRRIRKAARGLIAATRWPGDDATPEDIAQLALLRLLWLQRQTRNAGRWRHGEATALLARACIETCLVGLYSLHVEDGTERMAGNNAKSFRRLMSYIADGDPIPPTLVDQVAASFGAGTDLPRLVDMASLVAAKTDESFTTDAYHRLYVPLSTFFAHSSGPALLRHVGHDERLSERPIRAWTTRSAMHTSDACMARLALALAERKQITGAPFAEYANAHIRRSITPVFVMTGRSMIRSVRLSRIPVAYRSLMALRRYYDTGQAVCDSYPERKARTKDALEQALQVLANDMPQQQRDLILDHFAETLTQSKSSTDVPE
jgi:hypothetical protein